MTSNITLWGVSISPYVRKVMVALAEKRMTYHHKETLPKSLLNATGQPVPVIFDSGDGSGKIPALSIDGQTIFDSSVIAGYLDLKYPRGNRLYPDTPHDFALARWFEIYSDTTLSNVIYQEVFIENVIKPRVLGTKSDPQRVKKAVTETLPPLLDFLNHSLIDSQWFSGDHFSMADAAIAIQLMSLEMAGYSLDAKSYPQLYMHLQRTKDKDSFRYLN